MGVSHVRRQVVRDNTHTRTYTHPSHRSAHLWRHPLRHLTVLTALSVCIVCAARFDPLMSHLRAYINDQNTKVTGRVSVQLYKGNITVTSLTSPYSLFNHNLATFNRNASFNQNASSGFIELYTLAMRTAHGLKDGVKELKPELATSKRLSDVSEVEK